MKPNFVSSDTFSVADGPGMLVVLHFQIHRISGYYILRAEKEERPHIYATCDSSRRHAHERLVRSQVHSR